jgi:hypothetical protein
MAEKCIEVKRAEAANTCWALMDTLDEDVLDAINGDPEWFEKIVRMVAEGFIKPGYPSKPRKQL